MTHTHVLLVYVLYVSTHKAKPQNKAGGLVLVNMCSCSCVAALLSPVPLPLLFSLPSKDQEAIPSCIRAVTYTTPWCWPKPQTAAAGGCQHAACAPSSPCKAVQTSVLSPGTAPAGAAAPRATRGLLTAALSLRAASRPTLRSVTCAQHSPPPATAEAVTGPSATTTTAAAVAARLRTKKQAHTSGYV